MLKVFYLTSLMVLSNSTLAIAPTMKEIFVCENCIQYYPKHWQEDNFPPVLMIRK
tara:strand:+ start:336 stop:500 length:165 start_codon:yes stop_codon:yes gene_type:complete